MSASNPASTLLIVEDDLVTREKMSAYFEAEGYRVLSAETALAARRKLEQNNVQLALLDINLPDDDGLALAREMRAASNIGIIFVSGRDQEIDRIVGLEIGADDYVTKPFNFRELLARVKSLIRRTETNRVQTGNVRAFSGWQLNTIRRTLQHPSGKLLDVTRAELELLDIFTRQPGATLSREQLTRSVSHRAWNPGDRTIDVLIRRLRQKIERDPSNPEIFKTIHGEGYMFCDTVETIHTADARETIGGSAVSSRS